MASTKAQKILKRTLMGSTLALVIVALLWLLSRSERGWPLLTTVFVLLIAGMFELVHMGTLRKRDLGPPIGLAAIAGIELLHAASDGSMWIARNGGASAAASGIYRSSLAIAYAWTILVAATAFGWVHVLARWRSVPPQVARLLVFVSISVVLVYTVEDELDVLPRLKLGLCVLSLLTLVTLPLVWIDGRVRDLLIAVGLATWLVPPLPGMYSLWREHGLHALIALLLLSKIGDSAGYYIGNAIGKSHPFPNISPGKTTAGCVASLVAAMIVGGVLVVVGWLPREPYGVFGGVLAGALVNVAAQAGDILESWIKRRAGVKDSSTVLGPSGGVLDQIDSLLVSIPVAVSIWPWIFQSV